MNTQHITGLMYGLFSTNEYRLQNTYIYDWESDFFSITKTGYAVEVEVKVSKSDFRADFKKPKHIQLERHKNEIICHRGMEQFTSEYDKNEGKYVKISRGYSEVWFGKNDIPNRFYYACPDGLLTANDVPKYAGLIHVVNNEFGESVCHYCKIVKNAPLLHNRKFSNWKKLLDKFYYESRNLEVKLKLSKMDLDELRHKFDEKYSPEFIKSEPKYFTDLFNQ